MVGISNQSESLHIVNNPKLEQEDAAHSPPEFSIHTFPADFTLKVLFDKFLHEKLEIPSFQRRFVWTKKKASRLIESFFMGNTCSSSFSFSG